MEFMEARNIIQAAKDISKQWWYQLSPISIMDSLNRSDHISRGEKPAVIMDPWEFFDSPDSEKCKVKIEELLTKWVSFIQTMMMDGDGNCDAYTSHTGGKESCIWNPIG